MDIPASGRRAADLGIFAAALLAFVAVVIFCAGCGTDDLVFPGNIPATFTASNTATPVPDGEI